MMIQAASGKNKQTMFSLVIPVSSGKAVYVYLRSLTCYVTQHHMNDEGGWILFVLLQTELCEPVFPHYLLYLKLIQSVRLSMCTHE